MPTSTPSRPHTIPGFRIALVREPGVRLSERPQFRTPTVAAPMLAQYIGETDREVFVIAMLTIRHRVLGLLLRQSVDRREVGSARLLHRRVTALANPALRNVGNGSSSSRPPATAKSPMPRRAALAKKGEGAGLSGCGPTPRAKHEAVRELPDPERGPESQRRYSSGLLATHVRVADVPWRSAVLRAK
jgi:hypothetical protein